MPLGYIPGMGGTGRSRRLLPVAVMVTITVLLALLCRALA